MASMLNHIEQRVIAAAGVKVSPVGPNFDYKNYGGEMEMVESRWQRLVPLHICSPHYRLSDSEDVVAWLGSSITQINVFDDQLMRWIPADLAHTFKLEPRSHVFIRRFGVTHFDDQYALAKESSWPRSLMFNMKGERQRLRQKIKCKDESDDDIEVIDGSLITPWRGVLASVHVNQVPAMMYMKVALLHVKAYGLRRLLARFPLRYLDRHQSLRLRHRCHLPLPGVGRAAVARESKVELPIDLCRGLMAAWDAPTNSGQ